jgi:Fe-S oxidoreductase
MHESKGIRINTERTKQALAKRPSIIATSCPYCLIMFEDGLKDEKAGERVKVMDVSELLRLEEAMKRLCGKAVKRLCSSASSLPRVLRSLN